MVIKKFILVSIIIFIYSSSEAQVCNFCSTNQLKEFLTENKIETTEHLSINGDRSFVFQNENYMKSWSIKYDKCYLYQIIILKKDKLKSLKELMNKAYSNLDENNWEDLDTKVQLVFEDGHYQFNFTPKLSYYNLINNNN